MFLVSEKTFKKSKKCFRPSVQYFVPKVMYFEIIVELKIIHVYVHTSDEHFHYVFLKSITR